MEGINIHFYRSIKSIVIVNLNLYKYFNINKNAAYTVSEIAQQLQAAKADVIFADSLQQEKVIEDLKCEVDKLYHIICKILSIPS